MPSSGVRAAQSAPPPGPPPPGDRRRPAGRRRGRRRLGRGHARFRPRRSAGHDGHGLGRHDHADRHDRWATASVPTTAPTAPATAPGLSKRSVTIAWVGDTVLASSYGMPPDGGRRSMAGVVGPLRGADLAFGNLEETLSQLPGTKCGGSPNCFAFQAPPSYARLLTRGRLRHHEPREQPRRRLRPGRSALDRAGARRPRAALDGTARADHDHAAQRAAHRAARLRPLPLGGAPRADPRRAGARPQGGLAGRPRGRRHARRRRGLGRDARAARHGDLPRREPRRLAPLLACRHRRRRRPRGRLGAARDPRRRALPRAPDRLLDRQLPRLQELRHRRDALAERDPARAPARRRRLRRRHLGLAAPGRKRAPAPRPLARQRAPRRAAVARGLRPRGGADRRGRHDPP